MKITYRNNELKNLCQNTDYYSIVQKTYGKEMAKKLPERIKDIKAYCSLGSIPVVYPYRRHKLKGNLEGFFAISITRQYRLIIKPLQNEEDLNKIDEIEIWEVSKHYE